ncbi:MAG: hypothetical protein NVS2B16_24550 [Chloroflexota bacterium]
MAFDFGVFCARIGATAKERGPVRQDLVRGLKDYFESTYGYDRYGAETILLLPERMAQPYVYGFALARLLHDRRVGDRTKIRAAHHALDIIDYGADGGLPYGLFGALNYLTLQGDLATEDLRYGLVVSAGEMEPFRGTDKTEFVSFFRMLLGRADLPSGEKTFWGHSLVVRHRDQPGATELIHELLGCDDVPAEMRRELCRAWINRRQPRLDVPLPEPDIGFRSTFVAEHLPFWIAHAPSWPTWKMVNLGLIWLARLGEDPVELAEKYIGYVGAGSEQVHSAVADIVAENHAAMPEVRVKEVIERGIAISGSSPTRRRFYRLGTDLYGPEYLARATEDAANSVRQWAVRQLQKQS